MNSSPLPIFDSIEYIDIQKNFAYLHDGYDLKDVKIAILFLKSYRGSQGTFNAYRREIERLLHWTALIANKSFTLLIIYTTMVSVKKQKL